MVKKLGAAALCMLLAAVIYAAAHGGVNRAATALAGDRAALLHVFGVQTAATAPVAPDQPIQSLSGELPAHDPTVGRLAGSAGTSGGAATYTIPIDVPPGRRGMQPSLSLTYSSRSGNGIAGMGWSLSGLSSLHRCPATIEQDGFVGPVAMGASDKLCLDGQRLVATSGAYGQSGTTYDTEIESFVRVTQLGGDLAAANTYFKIETKAGDVLYYGNNSSSLTCENSAAPYCARVVPGGLTAPLSWMLAFKSDQLGNNIHYVYVDYGNGEVLARDIFYTGFGSTDGNRDIHLNYQPRPTGTTDHDVSSSWLAGGVTMQTQRLTNISTWAGPDTTASNQVRAYILNYGTTSQSTHRSLLASVQECGYQGGTTACRPPTTFAWQQGPMQSLAHVATVNFNGTLLTITKVIGDLDGDGSREALATDSTGVLYIVSLNADRSVKSAFPAPAGTRTANAIGDNEYNLDFDLDGRADLFTFDSNNNIIIYFWDGPRNATTFAQAFTRSWNTGLKADPTGASGVFPEYIGDMDGDGRPDIVLSRMGPTANCPTAELDVYRNVVNPAGPDQPASFPLLTSTCLNGRFQASVGEFIEHVQQVVDVNGDGIPDLLLSSPLGNNIKGDILYGQRTPAFSLRRGAYQSLYPATSPPSSDELSLATYALWIDVNGDGLKDLVHADTGGNWSLRLNTGHGLGNRIALANNSGIQYCTGTCAVTTTPNYAGFFQAADVDGDGRQELLVPVHLATTVCSLEADNTIPLESQSYYACPEDPASDNLNYDAVSNITENYAVVPMYQKGYGGSDHNAYQMDALHFIETGPGQFQILETPTERVDGSYTAATDLYGDGLEDSLTLFGCSSQACMNGRGAGAVNLVPGTYVNEGRGPATATSPSGQMDPDGTTPELPDLMATVIDGMGAQTTWTYYQLSSAAGRSAGQTPLYTIPTDPALKYVDNANVYFASSMPVVSDMTTSDGIGGLRATRYGYGQAMYNELGRGFQGFRTIIEEDLTQGLRTTTTYDQKFPLAGQVTDVVVNAMTRTGTSAPIKHEAYTWLCDIANRSDTNACTPQNGNAVVKFPFLDTKQTWTYDTGVALAASRTPLQTGYTQDVNAYDSSCAGTAFTAASGFDAHGNLTGHTVLSSDSGTGTGGGGFRAFVALQCNRTAATYTANTTTWWLDQLNSTTTTRQISYNATNHALPTGASNPAQTVTTNDWWNPDRTLHAQTVQPGVANQQRATTYSYTNSPNYGLPTGIAVVASGDPDSPRTSGISYSADGYFPSVAVNPLAQSTSTTLNPSDGQPALSVDENGLRTLMTYDAFGQLILTQFHGISDSVQRAPDRHMALNWCTWCTSQTTHYYTVIEQDGAPTQTMYDDILGRPTFSAEKEQDGVWSNGYRYYTTQGELAGQYLPYRNGDPIETISYRYDALGRVTQKIVPKGAEDGRGDLETQYTYSGTQTVIQVCGTLDVGTANCLNMTRTTDSMGRYMVTYDARGGITQYWVDANGNTLALQDANNSVTTAAYNALGQRSSVSDPNQGTWSFTYDALGDLLTQTDARGIVTTTTYDPLSRPLTRIAHVDVTGDGVADTVTDSWTYDPANGIGEPATSQRMVYPSEVVASGAIERSQTHHYDTLARLYETDTTQQIAAGVTKAYKQTIAYDSYYGWPKSVGYPNGEGVGTLYSPYGQPIASFNPAAGGETYRNVASVDARGQPIQASLGNGTTDWRGYRGSTGETLGIELATTVGSTNLRQLNYHSDVFSNLTAQYLSNGATSEIYTYDALQRMTHATRGGAASGAVTYVYDPAGNFTSKTDFSISSPNAYTYTGGICGGGTNAVKTVAMATGGTRTYCYDANGNLTSDSAGLAVKYDHDNLAYQTTRGSATITMAYGPDNQRTREWGSDGTKVYLDGGYEDWISAGSTKVYVDSDAEITDAGSTRTVNYMLTDRLGSMDTISDASGNIIETRGSDPFGKPRSGTWADLTPPQLQSTAITEHGFTGHAHLNSVQLIHMNGRVYDYQLGRFLSVDPHIDAPLNSQSLNPYSYIMNNPLAGTDPTGYDADPTIGTHIPGVEAVGTETSATGSHLPSASAFGNESAGTGKKANGTQTQGATSPAKPSAVPAITSASQYGSHAAFQEDTAAGRVIDLPGVTAVGQRPFPTVEPPPVWAGGAILVFVGVFMDSNQIHDMITGHRGKGCYGSCTCPGASGNMCSVNGNESSVRGPTQPGTSANAGGPDDQPPNGDDSDPSWSKARSDYWKARARNAKEGEFSPENLERMRQGKPPLHDELGVAKELHHTIPQRNGGSHAPSNLQEVWPWEHDAIDPFRHYNGPRPPGT